MHSKTLSWILKCDPYHYELQVPSQVIPFIFAYLHTQSHFPYSTLSAKSKESSRTTGFMQEHKPKSELIFSSQSQWISVKVYKPNILSSILALKVISNKKKNLIFMR